MAKSHGFFTLRRGSTKSHTYSVLEGQQITKDRVTDVKNPRSARQMFQRMLFATVSAMTKALKRVVDHSFEGVTYGAPSLRKFRSEALHAIRQNLNTTGVNHHGLNAYGNKAMVPIVVDRVVKVSEGSLPTIEEFVFREGVAGNIVAAGLFVTDMPDLTVGTLRKMLNCDKGDHVTIVGVIGSNYETFADVEQNASSLTALVRLTFPQDDSTVLTDKNIATVLNAEYENAAASAVPVRGRAMADFQVAESDEDGNSVTLLIGPLFDDEKCIAGAVIRSKDTGERSTSYLYHCSGMGQVGSAEDILATYPIENEYVLNGADM